jgi:hypothetical protein
MRRALFLLVVACGGEDFPDDRAWGPEVAEGPRHAVTVHLPTTLGVVDTSRTDVLGRPIGVACTTCHGPNATEGFAGAAGAPETFHQGVELRHGELPCAACHDGQDRSKLHLADGTLLDMGDVRQLCGQCHGSQHRDWQRGIHGGMSGYWDLRRGPRVRNVCIDCHAAHQPRPGQVMPVLPPRDRHLPEGEHP